MSPDQYSFLSSTQRKYLEQRRIISDSYPNVSRFGDRFIADFKSVSFFLGDKGDVMVLAKRFSDDGGLEILWSSGDDFTGALINLDKALGIGQAWRPDKDRG